ncbi:hypothetical protein I7I48_09761 [Histoplasma ohiense]|nr:hypothetical protein I7I48_09761 [Histoplasma ohiense (nom. inval.)]
MRASGCLRRKYTRRRRRRRRRRNSKHNARSVAFSLSSMALSNARGYRLHHFCSLLFTGLSTGTQLEEHVEERVKAMPVSMVNTKFPGTIKIKSACLGSRWWIWSR